MSDSEPPGRLSDCSVEESFVDDDPQAEPSASTPEQTTSPLDPNVSSAANETDFVSQPIVIEDDNPTPRAPTQRQDHILDRIQGLYPIFDLISEQSIGGLVEKVIINQAHLHRLINDICPGAYKSLTKVNFKALDGVISQVVGVYGDRTMLVNFMQSLGMLDNLETIELLNNPVDGRSLQSGLYILRPAALQNDDLNRLFILYWPEETTWNGAASSTVRRNRETFMRYLTQASSHTICLLTDEQAKKIDWTEKTDASDDEDGSDRLFLFEVSKVKDDVEAADARAGFRVKVPSTILEGDLTDRTLLVGETMQALMTVKLLPSKPVTKTFTMQGMNPTRVKIWLKSHRAIDLHPELNDIAIENLIACGLGESYPEAVSGWQQRKREINEKYGPRRADERCKLELGDQKQEEVSKSVTEAAIHSLLIKRIVTEFPILNEDMFPFDTQSDSEVVKMRRTALHQRVDFKKILNTCTSGSRFQVIFDKDFNAIKERIAIIQCLLEMLPSAPASELLRRDHISWSDVGSVSTDIPEDSAGFSWLLKKLPNFGKKKSARSVQDCIPYWQTVNNTAFFSSLQSLRREHPKYSGLVGQAISAASNYFQRLIPNWRHDILEKVSDVERDEAKTQIESQLTAQREVELHQSRALLAKELSARQTTNKLTINAIEVENRWNRWPAQDPKYKITVREESISAPALQHTVFPFSLDQDDQQSIRLDPTYIPRPKTYTQGCFNVELSLGDVILFAQMLGNDKFLLVVKQSTGINIYLDRVLNINRAVSTKRHLRTLDIDRLADKMVICFDEKGRYLVLCSTTQMCLHVYKFDESFRRLSAVLGNFNLKQWYTTGGDVEICHVAFIHGQEEVLLVDSTMQGRIFSLVTQGFRPATLSLPTLPTRVFSSPDSSACIAVFEEDGIQTYTVIHWDSFGASAGIQLQIPFTLPENDTVGLTSFVSSNNVHLVWLDFDTNEYCSVAIKITKKETELQFTATKGKEKEAISYGSNSANILLDCHSDVWVRYPITPAIEREDPCIESTYTQPSLTFICTLAGGRFQRYFSRLITKFESKTQKPGGNALREIKIGTLPYPTLLSQVEAHRIAASHCYSGKWFMNLLCLIPIQLAIPRNNSLIPLCDGVVSGDLEDSFAGASVNQVIDSMSWGWYESIFSSYLAAKPVKVVSSMGEQSVGKSYSLNHFVGSSFAGSAMRTTEGVWMSITNTPDVLVVALDFEGVHSIERSAQEDAFLVLLNAAVSNLVLFRNNFSISRDIKELFNSFQSSSLILDPQRNPELFRSKLAIIIKDVIQSDKNDIVREFRLRFQAIVEEEQDRNFISQMHDGEVIIIPWPIMQSREFYKLFNLLKRELEKQPITHMNAGEFMLTLKAFIAKIKATDWQAMSQTMISHRTRTLERLLPLALIYGFIEAEEPLKNLDTDTLIEHEDSHAQLFFTHPEARSLQADDVLLENCRSWDGFLRRDSGVAAEWTSELSSYLAGLVDRRITHVQSWIQSNISRFPMEHPDIQALLRFVEVAVVDLRANAELCRMSCNDCQLSCLRGRRHNLDAGHDCHTDHLCSHGCEYANEHAEMTPRCGYPAGHSGPHVCDVNAHLCGVSCKLTGKRGCLGQCTSPTGHEGDHLCAASVHSCGERCSLQDVLISPNQRFSCSETCTIPSHMEHDEHRCDNKMCTISCSLCSRLCINNNHLHAVQDNVLHLCGQEHACPAPCDAAGICQIDTTPQSMEMLFEGRHAKFHYTRYSQTSRRLQCAVPVPPGKLTHHGAHVHSLDASPFHFCQEKCGSCGFYCTLPLGHPQREHETSHGSMSNTRWSIQGQDNAVELKGRKFVANEEGSPWLCSLICKEFGRHAHIDFCRGCEGRPNSELEHIDSRVFPEPERQKDWVSHKLYWMRSGFKDPYSRDEQAEFAKCDSMCPGPEHEASHDHSRPANPSYCTLPIFHPPQYPGTQVEGCYVSRDGHTFPCADPAPRQQFHVIFVIDRSGSMSAGDRRPLPGTPVTVQLQNRHNDRLGAVYSAIFTFLNARNAPAASVPERGALTRDDAYSIILFDQGPSTVLENDTATSVMDVMNLLMTYRAGGGTSFERALKETQVVLERHWSNERYPVVVFFSDGEDTVAQQTVRNLCQAAARRQKPLSLHTISFGHRGGTQVLQWMAGIAREEANAATNSRGRDPTQAQREHGAIIPSAYHEVIDTVKLSETFLGIAESLRKPRGALFRSNGPY